MSAHRDRRKHPEDNRRMTQSAPHYRFLSRAALAVTACALLCTAPAPAQQQPPAPTTRTVSGTVTDEGREPIRGAIVNLQNPATESVVTYITAADGQYHFKRLDGTTDFRIWVSFRGHRSEVRSISKFDSHLQQTINFKIKPY